MLFATCNEQFGNKGSLTLCVDRKDSMTAFGFQLMFVCFFLQNVGSSCYISQLLLNYCYVYIFIGI